MVQAKHSARELGENGIPYPIYVLTIVTATEKLTVPFVCLQQVFITLAFTIWDIKSQCVIKCQSQKLVVIFIFASSNAHIHY